MSVIRHKKPVTTTEKISPQKAQAMLETNTNNRRIKPNTVEALVKHIEAGEWMVTHQGIAFDWHGRLLDGQHRLLAIMRSGIEVECQVTRNMQPEIRQVIDTGRSRSMADQLDMMGAVNSRQSAAALRILWTEINHGNRFTPGSIRLVPSKPALVALTEEYPDFYAYSQESIPKARRMLAGGGWAIWLGWRFAESDAETAVAYWDLMETGVGVGRNSCLPRLRDNLRLNLDAKGGADRKKGRYTQLERAALVIKGFNAFATGEHVTKQMISWKNIGRASEPFPQIVQIEVS